MEFIVFCFFLYLTQIYSLENLWIMRHCDKNNDDDPCCSQKGYERALHWHEYLQQYIIYDTYVYGAGFGSDQNECITNDIYSTNKNCQQSQRMFLTAYSILKTFNKSIGMNIDYCSGDYEDLTKSCYKQPYKDVVVAWKHEEITDIIKYIGIEIDDWPDDVDEYNIIFMIDVKTNHLYYDCYNFEDNTRTCTKETYAWLEKYDNISEYYLI